MVLGVTIMKESVTIDDVIVYLNELVELDKPAMAALIANRVPCNQQMADHPTAQVHAQHGGFFIGLVGIINGMFGVNADGWGPITWVFEEDESSEQMIFVGVKRTAKVKDE